MKVFGGQYAKPSSIICRQRGTKWRAGKNAYYGRDWTIHAKIEGIIYFDQEGRRINVRPLGEGMAAFATGSPPYLEVESRTTRRARRYSIPREPTPDLPDLAGRFLIRLSEGDRPMPRLKDLRVRSDASRRLSEPGFGSVVVTEGEERYLNVPPIVAKVLESMAIDTASEFLAYARTYPSQVADSFAWSRTKVEPACKALEVTIREFVDANLIDNGDDDRPEQYGFGAILPDN